MGDWDLTRKNRVRPRADRSDELFAVRKLLNRRAGQEVRSSERARRVKILEETGAQRVQAAVLGLRGGASEVEAVLTLVRGVRAL
jgi:hypothetical protein